MYTIRQTAPGFYLRNSLHFDFEREDNNSMLIIIIAKQFNDDVILKRTEKKCVIYLLYVHKLQYFISFNEV